MNPSMLGRYVVRCAVAFGAMLAIGACSSSAGNVDSEQLQSADEKTASSVSEELSAGVPVGSLLATTANLNLRTGASTRDRVLHVIPTGAHVTTVNRATPVSGWYNVKHNGVVGWSYGTYLKLVSTPGGGGGGGGSSARSNAVARAKDGVGFSYWWGHGRWLASGPSSSTRGSCAGSCPSCTHHGSYGADCSGYVAKIWDVPSSNSNVSVDEHPYSTYNFRFQTISWHRISRSAAGLADALTHHDSGSGHIFLHESGDGWGSMWAYEARGCASGIVHDLRTASSAYVAIARNGY